MPRGRSTKRRTPSKPTASLTDEKWASMVPFGTFVSEFDIQMLYYEAHVKYISHLLRRFAYNL